MEKQLIVNLVKPFEDFVHKKEGIEYWYARDLQKLLGYVEWRKFLGIIKKAQIACKTSKNCVLDHFVGTDKKVLLGLDAQREIQYFMLTRINNYKKSQN